MTLLAHEIRFGLCALVRNPRPRMFTLLLPLILLIALVGVSGGGTTTVGGDPTTLRRFFTAGIMAMALLASCYGALVSLVVVERENGIYKRRRATPVPPWVIIAGTALTTLLTAFASAALLLVVAKVLYGVGIPAAGLGVAALAVTVGGLALACLAFAVASVLPDVDAAQPVVQLTMLPLYFVSGIWFSTDDLPEAVRRVAELLPVEPLAHQLHLAFQAPRVDAGDVLTLAAWAAIGIAVAARRFTWLPHKP